MDLAEQTARFNFFSDYQIYPGADPDAAIELMRRGIKFRDRTS
jgi:hypothetical protein